MLPLASPESRAGGGGGLEGNRKTAAGGAAVKLVFSAWLVAEA